MIGGMLGMAIIGTLMSHLYHQEINGLLLAGGGTQWARWLTDPQILVDPALAGDFSAAARQAGQDAAALLSGARTALVDAIHGTQWAVAAFVVLALWLVRRVPAVDLHRSPQVTND
jgi:hypothetical protein